MQLLKMVAVMLSLYRLFIALQTPEGFNSLTRAHLQDFLRAAGCMFDHFEAPK
jgi:hypothetical protein